MGEKVKQAKQGRQKRKWRLFCDTMGSSPVAGLLVGKTRGGNIFLVRGLISRMDVIKYGYIVGENQSKLGLAKLGSMGRQVEMDWKSKQKLERNGKRPERNWKRIASSKLTQ